MRHIFAVRPLGRSLLRVVIRGLRVEAGPTTNTKLRINQWILIRLRLRLGGGPWGRAGQGRTTSQYVSEYQLPFAVAVAEDTAYKDVATS